MPWYIIFKLLQTEDKEKYSKSNAFLIGENSLNDRKFLILNHGGRRKWYNIFQVLKRKNYHSWLLYQWKHPLGMKRNEDILRWRKAKRTCWELRSLKKDWRKSSQKSSSLENSRRKRWIIKCVKVEVNIIVFLLTSFF